MSSKKKAMVKKEGLEAERAALSAAQQEAAEAASWNEGARDSKKLNSKADNEAEKLRKAKEKKDLEAADGAMLSGIVSKKSNTKKKKGDDFDLLTKALEAAPKTKAQKEAEVKKKADDAAKAARIAAEETARLAKIAAAQKAQDEIERLARKGMVSNHTDDLFMHSRHQNKLEEDDDVIDATGLESALSGLSGISSTGGAGDPHPERRMKALFNAYSERELAELKETLPGLKLSQYKERIFESWKKSPENPLNMPKAESSTGAGAGESVFKMP